MVVFCLLSHTLVTKNDYAALVKVSSKKGLSNFSEQIQRVLDIAMGKVSRSTENDRHDEETTVHE